MKRILNVADFSTVRLKNCYINAAVRKVSKGLIKNGYDVIEYSDRDMCRLLGYLGSKNIIGEKRLQNHFIDFCVKTQPDAILLNHADTIYPETLKTVKQLLPNVKLLQYNIDAICPTLPHGLANAEKIKSKLDIVDATIITTADKDLVEQFVRPGKYVGYMPNIADKSVETGKMFEVENPEFDLIFGGTQGTRQFCGKKVLYMDIINILKSNIKNIKMNVFGLNKKGKLEGPNYQNAYLKAAMGINLSAVNDNYLYSSDRMAHIMGNGLLCLVDEATGFKDIFSENEVAFYKTEKEFLEKIEFYKNNPQERMRIAKNGYNKYYQLFNETIVAQYIIDILFNKIDEKNYPWIDVTNKKEY